MAEPKVSVLLTLVDKLTAPAEGAKASLKSFESQVSSLVKGLVALGASVAVGKFFKDAVTESLAAEKAMGFLRNAVNNAGESFAAWQPQIDKSINSLVKMTKYGDDDFREALTNMIAKTGDMKGSLANLTLVADVAAKQQIGLAEAGDIVGKAMNGNAKAFKLFGIETGTTAEKMAILRERTRGYADSELNTLGGRLAQGKAAFKEMQEQVGNMITGSDGARAMAGKLATAMADLAIWIEKNKDAGIRFVDSLVSTASAAVSLLKPVWSLIVAMKDGIEATVGWGNIFRGFQIALVGVSGMFGALAASAKGALGAILVGLGHVSSALTFINNLDPRVVAGKVAKSTDVIGASWKAMGKTMIADAQKSYDETIDITKDKILLIATATEIGQKQITKVHDEAGNTRTTLTKEELAAREKATKEHAKKLADISEQMGKELLQAVHVSYKQAASQVKGSSLEMQGAMLNLGDVIDVAIDAKLWEAGQTAEDTKGKFKGLGKGIQDGAEYFLEFAQAAGVTDQKLLTVVGTIGTLGGSLEKILTGDVAGGIAGAVVSLGGILGSLFGVSPAEQERRALLKKNSDRLKELQGEMHAMNLSTPGGQIAAVSGLSKEGLEASSGVGYGGRIPTSALAKYLQSNGISLTAFREMAKEAGIDLMEKDGAFDTNAFRGVIEYAKAGSKAFGSDFAGKQDASAAERTARGTDTAAQQAADLYKNLESSGGGALANILKSFDLTNAAGRASARSMLGDILSGIAAGTFDAGALFQGLSIPEGMGVLSDFVASIAAAEASAPKEGEAGFTSFGTPPAGTSAGTGAPSTASTIGAATSGASGVSFASDGSLAYLSSIVDNTKATADNTATLINVALEIADGVMATAAGVTGDALTERIDRALYLASQNSDLNSGTV